LGNLEKYKKDIYRCIHCRACRFAYSGEPDRQGFGDYSGIIHGCVSGNKFEWEAYWGSGRIWIARALLEGDLKASEEVSDILFRCPTCGNCQTQCDNDIPISEIIEAARAECIDSGIPPQPKHRGIVDSVLLNNNPYAERHDSRTNWYDGKKDRRSEVAYFVGCTTSYRLPNIGKATANLLRKAGVDFTVLSNEVCCGSPLLRIGQVETARKLAKQNMDIFRQMGVSKLVFSCSGCYRTFKIDYPKYVGDVPFELKHASEFICDLFEKGIITPRKEFKRKVTWHDPCHLGRHVTLWFKGGKSIETPEIKNFRREWFEKPRKLLKSIPGIDLVEMYRIKEDAWCCGAGGGVKSAFPDFALETAYERIKEAEATGAEAIVTSCPFCVRNFNDAVANYGSNLKVFELIELLDMAT